MLTDELIKIPFVPVNRGKYAVSSELRPDATLFIGASFSPIHVEMDMDTESYRVIKRKMQPFIRRGEPVVWIAPTESRMDGIRAHAKAIAEFAYFKLAGSDVFYDYNGTEYLWQFPASDQSPETARLSGVTPHS